MARFDYQSLPLTEIARQYIAGASWRALAKQYGCPDHKTLKKHTMAAVPDLATRTQAESQATRRAAERGNDPALARLTKDDVYNWHDPYVRGGQ